MMEDNSTGLFDNAAKKAVEGVGNRVGNAAVDAVKKAVGEAQVSLGSAYTRYLENAVKRYNRIKTIATGTQYRSIIGENALYVHVGVKYRGKEKSTQSIEKLLPLGNHLLIEGTGGAGKTMLMRYLFLDTAYAFLNRGGTLIPVLLELRRLNTQASKDISAESILESIYSCMREFDAQLDIGQVESSLRKGKLLLLFDGFDEVSETLARETADAIQVFCSKYPKNPCVVTSRPNAYTVPLQTFSMLESMPLRKDQAVRLAGIIWDEDEKTREFCNQLDKELFDKHKDFAENPLLLTMMFLTFMRNLSIPEHLSEFYQKAYDALYSTHDNQNKGVFKREFKCKTLDEKDFTRLFSWFCFQSYFKNEYEFTQDQFLSYLERGLEKLGFIDVNSRDYLADLQKIVCMIVKEGNQYKFTHRSFQTYFAALYTCGLTEESQKRFYKRLLSSDNCTRKIEFFDLMYQLAPDRFTANALEVNLQTLQNEIGKHSECDVYLLKVRHSGVFVYKGFCSLFSDFKDMLEIRNSINIFSFIMSSRYSTIDDKLVYRLITQIMFYMERFIYQSELSYSMDTMYYCHFDDIDSDSIFSSKERKSLYQLLVELDRTKALLSYLRQWLSEQASKRSALESSDDFASLLDAL